MNPHSTLARPVPRSTEDGPAVRRRPVPWRRFVATVVGVTGMLLANGGVASAHQWGQWHWHRGGPAYLYVWNGMADTTIGEAARRDIHNRPHPVYLFTSSQHTDISLLSGNFGATWGGLAEMIDYSYPHVTHAHATLNTYYYWSAIDAEGVMCQELAHTLGLDHAATGDCMGKGYFSGSTNFFGADSNTGGYSHPTGDLKNMYSTVR
ncbi:MAG: hypothetical protein LC792_14935 [Actinobacteria bacterium]|nr:hypothetical protein [Actinomycetota bacterium]